MITIFIKRLCFKGYIFGYFRRIIHVGGSPCINGLQELYRIVVCQIVGHLFSALTSTFQWFKVDLKPLFKWTIYVELKEGKTEIGWKKTQESAMNLTISPVCWSCLLGLQSRPLSRDGPPHHHGPCLPLSMLALIDLYHGNSIIQTEAGRNNSPVPCLRNEC